MLRYSRHVHVEAEGPNIQIVHTHHYQVNEECESSVLYQHVMLGAQNEFQTWLDQQTREARRMEVALPGHLVRRQILRTATKWTRDLSTEVLLLLAADDKTLVENRGDWPAGESAIDIIRGSLKVDILITLATLWIDTNRELLSKLD